MAATTTAPFIGVEALETIANNFAPQIAMGATHFRPDVFDRLKIKVVSGLQYKSTRTLMNRKGHTTKRKDLNRKLDSTIGYLEERKMIGHLAWNHYLDTKDNYNEFAIVDTRDNVTYTYPLSALAVQAAVSNYGEDLFDCLWHGDATIPKGDKNEHLNLFTGFIPYLSQDIAMGRVSLANGNLVQIGTIAAPVNNEDMGAYSEFVKFRDKWHPNLKNQQKVMVYCTDTTGASIAGAYANSRANHATVIYQENGNFRFPEWPNIEVAPDSSLGKGDKLIATVPENFEYGVDSLDSRTSISVRMGTDTDHSEISFQVQSIQGTRVFDVNPGSFCMTDGNLVPIALAGDYTQDVYSVTSNNADWGAVTVNGAAPDNAVSYAPGVTLALKATATSAGVFKMWSDGNANAERTVVTKGQPSGLVALFAAKE